MGFEAVVIGASAGGVEALQTLLSRLPRRFPLPIAIVLHVNARSESLLVGYLDRVSALVVKEAEDKEPIAPGTVYFAPPGYHLLIEQDRCFSLSVDQRINYSCPSIDVLFESAADAFGPQLIGVVLTGANADGADGLKRIKDRGGIAIVQRPEEAFSPTMPRAALAATFVDHSVSISTLAGLLTAMTTETEVFNG